MSDERQKLVETLFHRAIELQNNADRKAFLDHECGRDPELRVEVERLLQQDDVSDGILDREGAAGRLSSTETFTEKAISAPDWAKYLKPSDYPGSLGRLGKYEVMQQIGHGGMGFVFRALAPELRREVAIKIQKPSRAMDIAKIARFKTEARAVAQLDHPNIVRIYDLEVDNDPPYIVLELVRGENLATVVQTAGQIEVSTAVYYILDAARGLQAAHRAGIIHRDVKPQNLMLAQNGTVKVLDLGLARIPVGPDFGPTDQINLTQDSSVAGSVEFMSPEQTLSLADATTLSDIYSLGCTLFWMVTGHPPFTGDNPSEIVHAHRNLNRPSILSFLPATTINKRLDVQLQRMMSRKAGDRPHDMQEVIAKLTGVVDEAMRLKRHKRLVAGISATSIAVVSLLLLLIWKLSPPSYDFSLVDVSDLHEVRSLAKLALEIEQVQAWKANYSKRSGYIAKILVNNPRANKFKDCITLGKSEAHSELVGEINKGLLTLDQVHKNGIPPAWRKLSEKALAIEISRTLNQYHKEEVPLRVGQLLSKNSSKNVLKRWGIADFPSSRYPDRQAKWIVALKKSIDEDIGPKAKWYECILATEAIEFESASGFSAILRARQDETVYRGDQSTANFDLWLRIAGNQQALKPETTPNSASSRQPASAAQYAEVDTGVRLIDCNLMQAKDGDVEVRWPAPVGVIDPAKFENLTKYLGMPKAFELRDAKLSFNPNSKHPSLSIAFEFAHEDLGACQGKGQLIIDTTSSKLLEYDSKMYEEATGSLPRLLKGLQSYRGFAVSIQDDDDGLSSCSLKAGKLTAVEMKVSFDDDWRIHFSGVPNVATRDALASYICQHIGSIKGMEAFCKIDSFRLDKSASTLTGNLAFEVPSSDLPKQKAKWTLDGAGKLSVSIPPEVKEGVATERTKLVSVKKPQLDKAEVEKHIRSVLAKLPQFGERLTLSSVTSSEIGCHYNLGLSIGDWPELRLGPIEVTELSGIAASVSQALSNSNIKRIAQEQWATHELHPRFGRSKASLEDWDTRAALGKVHSTVFMTDHSIPLEVNERCRIENGQAIIEAQGNDGWVRSKDFALSQSLKPQIASFCSLISATASEATGVKLKLLVDDSNPSEPWLRLSPPRVRLKGDICVPLIQTDLGFGKFDVGQDAISMPKVVIIKPRMTLTTPYVNFSDPSFSVDWETNAFQLGIKVTAPCPSFAIGSLSTSDLASYHATGVGMGDIRWDNLALHAGHFGIRADARSERVGASGSKRLVFGAESDMVVLNDMQIAQGRGEIAFSNWELERLGARVDGELSFAQSSLGSIHGNLQIVPNNNMTLAGMAEMAGFELKGDLRYSDDKHTKQPKIDIRGRAKLEILRVGVEADVQGTTDLAFKNYKLVAGGSIPWPLTVKRLFYELTATPPTCKLRCWWQTPDGRTVQYVTEAPRVDLFDQILLEQELTAAIESSVRPEVSLIDISDEILQQELAADNNGKDTSSTSVASNPGDASQETAPKQSEVFTEGFHDNPSIVVVVEDNVMKVVSAELPRRQYGTLTLKEAGLESWDNATFHRGWTPRDEIWIAMGVDRPAGSSGVVKHYLLKGDSVNEQSIPSKFLAFGENNGALKAGNRSPDEELAHNTFYQALKMHADGYKEIETLTQSLWSAVSGKSDVYGDFLHTIYYRADQTLGRLSFFGLSEEEKQRVFARYGTGVPDWPGIDPVENFGNFVVATNDSGSKSRVAIIRRETRDQFLFLIQTETGNTQINVKRVESIIPWQLYRIAAQLANSIWKDQLNSSADLYIGEAGACLVEEDGWRIMSTDTAFESQTPVFTKVTRDSFVRWAPPDASTLPSVDLLPQALRDSKVRDEADNVQIARQSVTLWQKLKLQGKSEERWHAHPMGLLLELVQPLITEDEPK